MTINSVLRGLILLAGGVSAVGAYASGYEKSIMWGGRTSGVAGIATPYIQGSQALYFNPAGLGGAKASDQDVTLNISPTWPQFKGPINSNNDIETSSRPMVLPYGLTYNYTLNDQWAIGVGTYISGGDEAKFDGVDFSPIKGSTEVKTDLAITEYALGASYKLNDSWRFGLAWRVVQAKANFSFVQRVTANAVANAEVKDLEDTQYGGYKLGAQFKMNEKTNFGFTYRSEVNFKAKGTMSTTLHTPAGTSALASGTGDATAKTTLPMSATLGVTHQCTDDWKFLGEYVWTQYSRVKEITVDSTTDSVLVQNWKDQHNIRLAGEFTKLPVPIRFGYVWTSQVTDSNHARASFTPPGVAHTITAGTGYSFGERWHIDGGLEYTFASGNSKEGAAAGVKTAGSDIRDGKYSVNEYALHLGGTVTF